MKTRDVVLNTVRAAATRLWPLGVALLPILLVACGGGDGGGGPAY
jgi:hypothetical protein